ncbi:MAG: YabP/YqfC family sporulation protein [Clostridiales bacterium]|jgi:sporulation protein YqfC|nr:YabP/YqfC family sporulation protein [Clostridiales bacterium]
MVFFDDLKDKLDLTDFGGGKIIIFDGGVYVEGHKGAIELSGETVVFVMKKSRLRLNGIGFRLSCISNDSATVRGKLSSLNFE